MARRSSRSATGCSSPTATRRRIYNGNVGTITGIDARSGQLTARLDGGREVSWSAEAFEGFRHGYAGTIYKGQGKTLDHTYLYHTAHWRSAASYVALTRQRESAQVFAARETARDVGHLAWQMARSEVKSASVAWATRDEVQQAQRARERQARQAEAQRPAPAQDPVQDLAQDKAADFWRRLAESSHPASPDRLKAKVQAALEARQQPAAQLPPVKEWLIPPIASRDGRDSLGWGLDQADITAALAADARVKDAKGEPWRHLERAYRDPHAAHAKLETLIRAEGWHGAAQRVQAKPDQLGRLLGRDGLFAGRFAQLDRAHAISAARSVASSLTRIAEVEQRAERDYRAQVAAQIARDTVGVPKLSVKAASVLEAVHAAASRDQPGEHWLYAGSRNRPAVARAWEEGRRNPTVAAEIDRFEAAARQRLGEAGVTAAFRAAREGSRLSVPGVGPEHRQALHQMARRLVAAQRGRADHDVQRNLEAARQREQPRERMRHRRGPSLGR
jgi:hypothetical protein